jgi:hypothetical protein
MHPYCCKSVKYLSVINRFQWTYVVTSSRVLADLGWLLSKRERAAVLNQGEREGAQPHSNRLVGGAGALAHAVGCRCHGFKDDRPYAALGT